MLLHHLSALSGPRRLLYAGALGAAAGALPYPLTLAAHLLIGWICAATVYLLLAAWTAAHFSVEQIRSRAREQDDSAAVLFLVMVAAVCAAAAGIGNMLMQTSGLEAGSRALHVTLAMLALAASWAWIQTLFAFHYAHRYYQSDPCDDSDDETGGGLNFPGNHDPDYFDFFYHATVVGMTSQVSDVQVTSRQLRRLTTLHGIVSFVFNLVLLALGVNAVAGSMAGG